MCGIAGFLDPQGGDGAALAALAGRMADRLAHRGPDDRGTFADAAAGYAVGFRRLAIIDLSPAGAQPMHSADGRLVIAYNGEIYNFRALRAELEREGVAGWRGHSDTEVMLAAFARWGRARTLEKLNGMFALALWDRERRELFLARDRFGEKPLYYSNINGIFIFGSELKSLVLHPAWRGCVDREALSLYLRYDYVPGPRTIFRDTWKLPPGHALTIGAGDLAATPAAYWDARAVAAAAIARPFQGGDEQAADEAERRLSVAVASRLESDVPIGSFLSGGIDSSLVTALMAKAAAGRVRTYSIGFGEPAYDEAPYAAAVARHLGTDHTELYVTEAAARDLVPALPEIYDEPFGDYSQLPTLLLSRLTRRHVTVGLSGEGGDELFGGYPRYARAAAEWERASRRPAWLRAAGATAARFWPRKLLNHANLAVGDKVRHSLDKIATPDLATALRRQVSRWPGAADPAGVGDVAHTLAQAAPFGGVGAGALAEAMLRDALTYLPDDLLVKVDRAAMSASLETRAPFLDPEVARFAWSLPDRMKIRDGETKWLLKRVLYRHIPPALVDRPKRGFDVPIGAWLRGALSDWAEALLDPARLAREGFVDPAAVTRRWRQARAGGKDHRHELWNTLMFQAWLEHWRGQGAVAAD